MPKLIAFDLDGTLTQHKSPLDAPHREMLDELRKRYRLLMVGAGDALRIFRQMGKYPLDIIGNYGMQEMDWDEETRTLRTVRDLTLPVDRPSVDARVTSLRQRFGFEAYTGGNVEFHPSGAVTIPLLGTGALLADKLAFDPDRKKRRAVYADVCALFPEYNVFVGGSSSFDMAPRPYDKKYALDLYCGKAGLSPADVLYVGDDYGPGGNDESVYRSGYPFLPIDHYEDTPRLLWEALGRGGKGSLS